MGSIAIAISVHNRHDVAKETIKQWKKFLPKGSKLFIVDDGSDIAFPNSDHRNETAQGIAACKNRCLELCEGADYIFLADDDVFPKVMNWHLPYINSGLNHLCFTFDNFSNGKPNGRRKLGTDNGITRWHEPCGLLMFYTKECLEKVGGMDESYGIWGYEHLNFSMRIHNAGLTPYPFMDVENSLDLFVSLDYEQTVIRSVDATVRMKLANVNKAKYLREIKSSAYIPFKQQNGIVLTTYLTGSIDPQRGEAWTADIEQCRTLAESVKRHNTDLVVINDCFSQKQTDVLSNVVNASSTVLSYNKTNNPYFLRWLEYRDYLRVYKPDNVWITDCNDVELLRAPFKSIQPGKLYVGWEPQYIGCPWMLNHHKSNFSQTFIKCNIKTPLLNAGVIGGRYDMIMEFLDRFCDMIGIFPDLGSDSTDMCLFNWILYSHFNGRFETGKAICSTFKAYSDNGLAIWRHK